MPSCRVQRRGWTRTSLHHTWRRADGTARRRRALKRSRWALADVQSACQWRRMERVSGPDPSETRFGFYCECGLFLITGNLLDEPVNLRAIHWFVYAQQTPLIHLLFSHLLLNPLHFPLFLRREPHCLGVSSYIHLCSVTAIGHSSGWSSWTAPEGWGWAVGGGEEKTPAMLSWGLRGGWGAGRESERSQRRVKTPRHKPKHRDGLVTKRQNRNWSRTKRETDMGDLCDRVSHGWIWSSQQLKIRCFSSGRGQRGPVALVLKVCVYCRKGKSHHDKIKTSWQASKTSFPHAC